MDGQVVTQEETEAMFSKITGVMDYLRNALVSNTELARQVQAMQEQINSLTSRIGDVVNQNTALQEAVNVLTQERDAERETNVQLSQHNKDLQEKFNARDNDANHWYSQYQTISAELEKVKAERSQLEEDHQRLTEEHVLVTAKLKQIQSVFAEQMATVEEIKQRQQPRDPVTQQWQGWDKQATG